jgi:hypothetical protein
LHPTLTPSAAVRASAFHEGERRVLRVPRRAHASKEMIMACIVITKAPR